MTISRVAISATGLLALAAVATPVGALARVEAHPTAAAPAVSRSASASSCGQSTRTYAAPDAVQFVSASTGWAAGTDRVLATTDGGAHWRVQRHAVKADYTEVDAISADDVWVVGTRSVVHTTDGGASWRALPEPCPAVSSVHFVSPTAGFAVAGGRLLRTSNAGRSWHAMRAPRTAQSVCFTSSQEGWLGARGTVYRTIDGGSTWARVVAYHQPEKAHGYPVALVQCSGPDSGWAELVGPGVGMSQQEHIGYYLNDDGASRAIFAEQYYAGPHPVTRRSSPGLYFAAFSAIDPSDAAFVDTCSPCGMGTAPLGIATRNGHSMSRPGKVSNLTWVYGAAFVSTSEGWVVGNVAHYRSGHETWKIVHTTDGGRDWATQYVA